MKRGLTPRHHEVTPAARPCWRCDRSTVGTASDWDARPATRVVRVIKGPFYHPTVQRVRVCQPCFKYQSHVHRITVAVLLGCLLSLVLATALASSTKPERVAVRQPSGWSLTALPQCRPAPCAIYGGVKVEVLGVTPDLTRWTALSHLTLVRVEYVDLNSDQVLYPGDDLFLLDAAGSWHSMLGMLGGPLAETCQDPTEDASILKPGRRVGPLGLCFQTGGPTSGRLLLMYAPQVITNTCRPIGEPFSLGPLYNVDPSSTGSLLEDQVDNCQAALINLSSPSVNLMGHFTR